MSTLYSCPTCKVSLPFNQAVLQAGNLVVTCPSCHETIILTHHPECRICSRPATHMEMHRLGNYVNAVYEARFNCDVHLIRPSEPIVCKTCNTLVPKKKCQLKDGNLVVICPSCQSETILLRNVTCEKCSKTPIYFGWGDHPNYVGKFIRLACEEHKFDPATLEKTPGMGTVIAAFVLTLAGYMIIVPLAVSIPMSLYAVFKAKEKRVKIWASVVAALNVVAAGLLVWIFYLFMNSPTPH